MAYQAEIEKLEARFREKPEQWFAALADAYRKAGDLDMALEVLGAWIDKRPNYTSGHIVLGRCYLDKEQDAKAAEAFENVLKLDMENVIALKSLSEICERSGDHDGARGWLQRLLEVDPMNEEAREALEGIGGEVAAGAGEPAPEAPVLVSQDEPAEPLPEPAEAEAEVEEPEELDAAPIAGFEPTAAAVEEEGSAWEMVEAQVEPSLDVPEITEEPEDAERPGFELEAGPTDEIEPVTAPPPDAAGWLEVEEAEEPEVAELEEEPEPEPEPEEVAAETTLPEPIEAIRMPPPAVEPTVTEMEPVDVSPVEMEAEEEPAAEEPAERPSLGIPEMVVYGEPGEDDGSLPLVGKADERDGVLEPAVELPAEEPESAEPRHAVPAARASEVQFVQPPEPDPDATVAEVPVAKPEPAEQELPLIVPQVSAAPEPEPVVTETMAELYASQGLVEQAVDIYRKLLAMRPGDARLQARLLELEREEAPAGEDVARKPAMRYAASATGGKSVRELLAEVVAAATPPAPPTAPAEPSAPAPEPSAPAKGRGFSFDDFFGGGKPAPADEPPKASGPKGPENDDFKDWLKGLKT